MHPLLHFVIVYVGIWSVSAQEVSLIMYLCSLPFCLSPWFNETVHVCAFKLFFFCEDYLIVTLKPGPEVNFLVHLQSFASDNFFHLQTGETTNKFFPFEMSMTISDIKIRIDISHSHIQPRRKMAFKGLIISINQHFTWAYWKKTVRAN